MSTVAEIVVVCAAALFALTLLAIATDRATETMVTAIATLFGIGVVAAVAGLAVSLIRDDGEWRIYGVAFAALAAFAIGEVGLAILSRMRSRDRRLTTVTNQAYGHIDARLKSHAKQRAVELERMLEQERARSQHKLIEQERALAEERATALARTQEQATDKLLRRAAAVQDELSGRIRGWSDDLTRTQEEISSRVERLSREQELALERQSEQMASHARDLHGFDRELKQTIENARSEFLELLGTLSEELRDAILEEEQQSRREIAQLSERLKAVSGSLREDAYREELDARSRLTEEMSEAERRVAITLERSLERAADRIVETAEQRFDEQVRESREETGDRLKAELERTRAAYAQQIEEQVEERMSEVARQTTKRLQRQLDQVVRQAEAQTATAEDRVAFITQRLEAAVHTAAGRVAEFETGLELELTTKLAEFERAVRHAEQSVGRETG